MVIHIITLPKGMRSDDLQTIIWDDEAGTVSGTHLDLPYIRRIFAAPKPVAVGV